MIQLQGSQQKKNTLKKFKYETKEMNKKFEDLENVPENSDDPGMVPFRIFV